MPSAKDEVVRRSSTRPDPRADPDSLTNKSPPPTGRPSARPRPGGLRDEVSPRALKHDPRADPDSLRGAALAAPRVPREARAVEANDVDVDVGEPPAEAADVRESSRPLSKVAEIERLVDRAAWKEIAQNLGPGAEAEELSPALALIYAVARRESAGDDAASQATQLAIESMAKVLGVAPESPLSLVLAKRMLRKPPAATSAPGAPARQRVVTWLIIAMVVGFVAGALLGTPGLGALHALKLF